MATEIIVKAVPLRLVATCLKAISSSNISSALSPPAGL
jgi:hypothetical protein